MIFEGVASDEGFFNGLQAFMLASQSLDRIMEGAGLKQLPVLAIDVVVGGEKLKDDALVAVVGIGRGIGRRRSDDPTGAIDGRQRRGDPTVGFWVE